MQIIGAIASAYLKECGELALMAILRLRYYIYISMAHRQALKRDNHRSRYLTLLRSNISADSIDTSQMQRA